MASFDERRKTARKEYNDKVKSGNVGYRVTSTSDPKYKALKDQGVVIYTPFSEAYAEYTKTMQEISKEEKEERRAKAEAKKKKNSELDKYVESGETTASTTDVYDKSVDQKNKSNWIKGVAKKAKGLIAAGQSIYGEVSDAAGRLQSSYNSFVSGAAALSKKANLDSLLKKLGLGDNKLLKALSSKFGLKSGLFDSWASDLVNAGMSFANTMMADIGNGILQGLYSKLNNENVFDKVILNSVVKPLRYAGANPNYKNTLLRACLESDMPKCLDYLDGYNSTKYLHTNNMWRRGIYAGKRGCWKVSKYIIEELNDQYTKYNNGTATGDEDIAFWYKSKMVEIFKCNIVYGYSNFDEDSFLDLSNVNTKVLRNYSYYGDNDITFNKKYKISSAEINTIAKLVNVNKFGADGNNKSSFKGGWNDPGAGTNIDVSNFSHIKKYIDPRNGNIKKLYVIMAAGSDEVRLVNEPLYKRLKYPMLDMLSKSTSKMIDSMLKSKTYNDLRYLFDTNGDKNGEGFVAGLIHNALKELQRVKALRTMDDIYKSRSTLNNKETEIGDFVPYVAPSTPTSTTSTDTSTTQLEEEAAIDKIIKDGVVDDAAFEAIGASSSDFKILNVTGMTPDQQTSAISSLIGSNTSLTLADTRALNKFSDTELSYSNTNIFVLYSSKTSNYTGTTEANKERIFKQLVAMDMLKNYASKYSIEALKSWYGSTTLDPIYEKDANGNIIYDANENGIVLGHSKVSTPDPVLSEFLDKFKDIANSIKKYYSDKAGSDKYTVKFDNQGIGETPNPIVDITPYSTLSSKPMDLTDESHKFVFLGWSKDPLSEEVFNYATSFITEDLVLYAIWEEANNFILEAKLLKENNSTLDETVYATIDHSTKSIYFPIKTKEKTSGSYVINISGAKGAACSVVTGSSVFITPDGQQNIMVTDIYGEQWLYSLKLVEVPNDAKRIAYITKEATISGISDSKLYLKSNSQNIDLTGISASRVGCNFNGWTLMSDGTGKITELAYESIASFQLVYAKVVEQEYAISYNDRLGLSFSGKHQSNYPTKYTYRSGAKLDTPEKDGYQFLGYYSDPSCEENSLLRNIPKFYGQSNIAIYADWMEQSLYDAQQNGIVVEGYTIDLAKIVFYTRYVVEGGEQWVVTNTGLARYTSVGDKISQARIDVDNTPLGISYVSNAGIFLCITKTSRGKINLYVSKDRGANWTWVSDVTDLKFQFFSGTGFETIEYLTFYLRLIYQGILFELKDNKIYANDNLFIDSNNVPMLEGLTISGVSVTIDGAFYLLVIGHGVIKITFKDFTIESIVDTENNNAIIVPAPNKENITSEQVRVWRDTDSYTIDTASVGSAYNNINANAAGSELNDDFDIDDPEIVANILRNARDVKVVIRTFRNASRLTYKTSSDGKLVPVYGPNDPGDWIWEENPDTVQEDNTPPVLWLAGYNNQGKYIPDISNPKEEVVLELRDTAIIKECVIKDGDLFKYHNETITPDNYKYYIGWNKNDGSARGLILTASYMNNYWNQPNKQSEDWEVKIDKYEMVEDEHGVYHKRFFTTNNEDDTNNKVNKFYINPEGSSDFQEYRSNNYGNEDSKRTAYYEMIKNEQKSTAEAYKSAYTVTQNANGTTRYDGITEDFYKYITGGCKEDAAKQAAICNSKNSGSETTEG